MNADSFRLAESFVGKNYAKQAQDSRKRREKLITTLLSQRSVPKQGWDLITVKMLLNELSSMDSNNFVGNAGAGEREGRVFSEEVRRRHYGLSHGIGRSGDIAAIQPKAAGSSLILQLTRCLVRSLIKKDIPNVHRCLVMPLATGMALVFCLLTLKQRNPLAKYVIWPRIDQKTCLKAILTAGLIPLIIDPQMISDELMTDLNSIETLLKTGKFCDARTNESIYLKSNEISHEILCILTTNSCFAPRAPDRLLEISRLCYQYKISHLVNNAYGLMSLDSCKHLKKAMDNGRVDLVVQSTDKNFMVPVGGAVIFADRNHSDLVDSIATLYPGRANMSPVLDLLITLLTMGLDKWNDLRYQQRSNLSYLKQQLSERFPDERVLHTPNNPISVALSLEHFSDVLRRVHHSSQSSSSSVSLRDANEETLLGQRISELGSMLFTRCVSGARIVTRGKPKTVGPYSFVDYGSHCYGGYPCPYINLASAIGMDEHEIDIVIDRLEFCMKRMIDGKRGGGSGKKSIELATNKRSNRGSSTMGVDKVGESDSTNQEKKGRSGKKRSKKKGAKQSEVSVVSDSHLFSVSTLAVTASVAFLAGWMIGRSKREKHF